MFSVGFVPDDWRKAVIIPVHKKGISGDVADYWRISLTFVASKIIELIIDKQIYEYVFHNVNMVLLEANLPAPMS